MPLNRGMEVHQSDPGLIRRRTALRALAAELALAIGLTATFGFLEVASGQGDNSIWGLLIGVLWVVVIPLTVVLSGRPSLAGWLVVFVAGLGIVGGAAINALWPDDQIAGVIWLMFVFFYAAWVAVLWAAMGVFVAIRARRKRRATERMDAQTQRP
ncbi:MAG: hypothetical protein U9N84_08310 [Actinomycetota bacterium]|nr:hypothetical protein [Actinomycetota bacterium]